MKKNIIKYISIMACAIIFNTSCNKEELLTESKTGNEEIVLRERSGKYQVILSKNLNENQSLVVDKKSANILSDLPTNSLLMARYLGRGYIFKEIPIANPMNIKFPIVDVAKLYSEDQEVIYNPSTRYVNHDFFSFSNHSQYLEKSEANETIKAGFKLNFKIFSIGSQNTFNKVFTNSLTNESNSVYGQLSINVNAGNYELNAENSHLRKKIGERFLYQPFVDEIYNVPIKNLINNQGGLVVTNFTHGGNAIALSYGTSNSTESKETRERKMDINLDASFGKEDDTSTVNFGSNNRKYQEMESKYKFVTNKTSIITNGGSYSSGTFTTATELANTSIDLSNWISGFEDINKHIITKINNGGLTPVSDFILEENFQNRINKILTNEYDYLINPTTLIEPYIKINIDNKGTYSSLSCFLVTRHSDVIKISDLGIDIPNSENPMQHAISMVNDKKNFYDLKYVLTMNSSISDVDLVQDGVSMYPPYELQVS